MFLCLLCLLLSFAAADWKGPRDRFWRHHVNQRSLVYKGVEYYNEIVTCLGTMLTTEELHDIQTSRSQDRAIGLVHRDSYRDDKVILVNVERAMTPIHVKAVQSLASCVRNSLPEFYESRSFYTEMGLSQDPGLGGNNPTHLAPLLGVFLPQVVDEMQRTIQLAYDTAGWSYYSQANATLHQLRDDEILPVPGEIGFRASEHLTYKDFKQGLADHTDGRDTFYTVNFAFSGPEDYQGGVFYLKFGEGDLWGQGEPPKETLYLKPNKYDCLVFLGGPYLHGVTRLYGGHREMFSSEMWNFPDAPFGSNLWNNEARRMLEYITQCNVQAIQECQPVCTVDMTVLLPEDEDEQDYIQSTPLLALSDAGLTSRRWCDLESGQTLNESDFHDRDEEPYFMIPTKLDASLQPIYWRQDLLPVAEKSVRVARVVKHYSGLPGLGLGALIPIRTGLPKTKTLGSGATWLVEYHDLSESEGTNLRKITPANVAARRSLQQALGNSLDDILKQVANVLKTSALLVRDSHLISWTYSEGVELGPALTGPETDAALLLVPLRVPPTCFWGIGEFDISSKEMYWGDTHIRDDEVVIFFKYGSDQSPFYALEKSDYRQSKGVPVVLSLLVTSGTSETDASKNATEAVPFAWPFAESTLG